MRDRRIVAAAALAVVVAAGASCIRRSRSWRSPRRASPPAPTSPALAARSSRPSRWPASIALEPGSWVPLTFTHARARTSPALALRERTQLVAALAARTRELEREQETFARLAVQHERARIARELHDIVAHHLAVMVVQAGAGRMAAASDDAARQAERFAGIRAAGGEALDEMARLLDLLEAERDTLPRLLERARAAGLHVRYRGPDELGDVALQDRPGGADQRLKHAPGADVDIDVGEAERASSATTARARRRRSPPPARGSGSTGLRERAAAAGGRLDAGPAPGGGWEVRATLPRTPVGALEDRH